MSKNNFYNKQIREYNIITNETTDKNYKNV